MKIAIYPGTFDPITYGHIDIISRSKDLFDSIIVAISSHSTNKTTLFTSTERETLVIESIKGYHNVSTMVFNKLLVEFMQTIQAQIVIRGIRCANDLAYEMQMANINKLLNPQIEYVFLPSDAKYSSLSSSIVKEIAGLHGNVHEFVPQHVAQALANKLL